ncbi:MAG TPA: tRNA pseudouridine(55) synthase TruB [Acidimicrobiales bacterium]|nr:tRNA pseudouridine(55) synthase TruB [Acidimicrobiales bacterium]
MAREPSGLCGLAVVDKPAGWTSHDVVARARKLLGERKVGHAGTLDPDATGILLLGVGPATRLLRFLTPLPKTYVCEIVLGRATTTLDDSGQTTGEWDMSSASLADVGGAAATLTGPIMQVPPMVSAVQVDGQRLYDLARQGIEVERAPRPVTVHRFDVGEPVAPGVFPAEVECSSGTFVRSLAADLGAALGGGAHLRALRRTAVGSFTAADAVPLDQLTGAAVLPPVTAVRDLPVVRVTEDQATEVGHGKKLSATDVGAEGDGPWAVIDTSDRLLAVYERADTGEGAARLRSVVTLPT